MLNWLLNEAFLKRDKIKNPDLSTFKGIEIIQNSEMSSLNEPYKEILAIIKAAQSEMSKDQVNWQKYYQHLADGQEQMNLLKHKSLNWSREKEVFGLNLRFLNNYYEYLLQKAESERSREALSELKYHLTELTADLR